MIVPIALLLKPESNVLDVPIGLLVIVPVNVKFDALTVVEFDVDHPVGILSEVPLHANSPSVILSVATLFTVYFTLLVVAVTSPFAVALNFTFLSSVYSTSNVLFVPPVTAFELVKPVAFVNNSMVLVPSVFNAVVALLENVRLDAFMVVSLLKLNWPSVNSRPVPHAILPKETDVALSAIV